MKPVTQIQSIVQAFFDNQLSPETQRAYRTDLECFTRFTQGIPLNQITQGIVIGYREYLNREYKPSTVIRRLAAIRAFFSHLNQCGVIPLNPTLGVKLPRKPWNATTEAFSDAEILRMLECSNPNERRILSVLAHLGLRRSELCSLKYSDLGEDRGIQTLRVLGKGGKERILPVPEGILSENTLARVAKSASDPLFTLQGSALTPDRVRHLVQRVAKRAGIKKRVSPHSFRATAVSNALDNGSNPVQVQHMCGWSDMSQISRYDKRRHEIHKSAVWNISYTKK